MGTSVHPYHSPAYLTGEDINKEIECNLRKHCMSRPGRGGGGGGAQLSEQGMYSYMDVFSTATSRGMHPQKILSALILHLVGFF